MRAAVDKPVPVEPTPWSRGDRIALALLVALAIGSLAFLVHPWFDATTDGAVYVITGRALAAGEGYAYLGEPFYLRPPGLSAMIAPLVGGPELDFHRLNLFVSAWGALCVVLFFVYLRPPLGWPLALLAAVVLWAQPGFQRLANQVMTDVPGAALLLLVLIVERWCARSRSPGREVALGLLIGLSGYVRSALVLLVPAIAVSRLLRRGEYGGRSWRSFALLRIVPFAATAALVLAPWSIRNRGVTPPPPVDQTMQYSAGTLIWNTDPGDPDSPRYAAREVLARVPAFLGEAVRGLGSLRLSQSANKQTREVPTTVRKVLGVAFAISLLVALALRREPGEIFVAGYLLVVSVFPIDLLDRYLLPVYLLALPAVVRIVRDVVRAAAGHRAATAVAALSLAALAAFDFGPRGSWSAIEERHREMEELGRAVAPHVEPQSRLGAYVGHYLSVFLDRPVYSLRFAVRRLGAETGTERVIDERGLDTIVFMASGPMSNEVGKYLSNRYPTGRRIQVGEKRGMMVRVR